MEIAGRTFCITGSLATFKQKNDAYMEIEKRSGLVTNSFNKSCDFLVIGSKGNPNWVSGKKGSKILTAEKYISEGEMIKIISEDDLNNLLENSDITIPELSEDQLKKYKVKSSKPEKTYPNPYGKNIINTLQDDELITITTNYDDKTKLIDSNILKIDFSVLCNVDEQHEIKQTLHDIRVQYEDAAAMSRGLSIPANWSGAKAGQVIHKMIIVFYESVEAMNLIEQANNIMTALINIGGTERRTLSARIWHEESYSGHRWVSSLN